MKIKKITVLSAAVLAALLSTTYPLKAQAYSYTADTPVPTFGLFCVEDGIIKNGTVKFDLSDSEMFSNKKALKKAEYIVSANKTVTFEIPFFSSYTDIPQFNVTVNEQTVHGEVWYGDNDVYYGSSNSYLNALSTDNTVIEEKLETIYSPVLDDTVVGTLYTVIPAADLMSITMKLQNSCSYVYDGANRVKESYRPDGTQVWTYENALSQSSYQFFFTGENIDFTADCEYQTETIKFKDFIVRNYNSDKEFYEEKGVQTDCLYAIANRLLHNKGGMAFSELFYNSFSRAGLNSYKFEVQLNGEATIRYSSELVVQADYRYEPTVYLVGHKQIGTYPTNYSITLNKKVPYIIQSSVSTKKSFNNYTASSTENFYFICCSVSGQSDLSSAKLIVCIVCGTGIIALLIILFFILRSKKRRN